MTTTIQIHHRPPLVVTITTRTTLGYGWTSAPIQTRDGLVVDEPSPHATGGWRRAQREHARARKINTGNDWRARLFVSGRPVAERVDDVLYQLEHEGQAVVVLMADPS